MSFNAWFGYRRNSTTTFNARLSSVGRFHTNAHHLHRVQPTPLAHFEVIGQGEVADVTAMQRLDAIADLACSLDLVLMDNLGFIDFETITLLLGNYSLP